MREAAQLKLNKTRADECLPSPYHRSRNNPKALWERNKVFLCPFLHGAHYILYLWVAGVSQHVDNISKRVPTNDKSYNATSMYRDKHADIHVRVQVSIEVNFQSKCTSNHYLCANIVCAVDVFCKYCQIILVQNIYFVCF